MIAHGKVGEERPTCVRPPSRRGNCSGYRLESIMNREIKHIEKLDIVDIMGEVTTNSRTSNIFNACWNIERKNQIRN